MRKSINPMVEAMLEAYLKQDNVKIELDNTFPECELAFIIYEGDEIKAIIAPLENELRLISSRLTECHLKKIGKRGCKQFSRCYDYKIYFPF